MPLLVCYTFATVCVPVVVDGSLVCPFAVSASWRCHAADQPACVYACERMADKETAPVAKKTKHNDRQKTRLTYNATAYNTTEQNFPKYLMAKLTDS